MNIAFVGLSGALKRKRACDVRLTSFANLMAEDNHVFVINRYSSRNLLSDSNIAISENVEFHEVLEPKNTGRGISTFLFFLSIICEPFYILKLNKKKKVDLIHIYSGHYFDFILYYVISRVVHAKTVYQYVEYRSALDNKGLYHKINSYLCDRYGPKLWDGVIAISSFLNEKAVKVNEEIESIVIPPLCDFSVVNSLSSEVFIPSKYILFCGSINYIEVIQLIINSYNVSLIKQSHKLVLVLGGKDTEVRLFAKAHPNIIVKNNLPYNELISLYKNADALLIPLRNTVQDTARFPNKICEYLASKGVIMTTMIGDIKDYFVNGENAIIASDYSIESFQLIFDRLYRNEYCLSNIKNNAYLTGLKFFDTKNIKTRLSSFLQKLIAKE